MKNKTAVILTAVADLLIVILSVASFVYWSVAMEPHGVLFQMFRIMNPFSVNPYLLGLATVATFYFIDSRLVRVVMSGCYALVILISLVSVMGMTRVSEFMYFTPHLVMIALCFACAVRKSSRNYTS